MVSLAINIVAFCVCAWAAVIGFMIAFPVVMGVLAGALWVLCLPFRALGMIGDQLDHMGITSGNEPYRGE